MTTETTTTTKPTSLFSAPYFWTTIGANALVFLGAFEALAVTTIMPTISRELDGEALYAVAFSGSLAASVIGMVAAGRWSDRRGPSQPLIAATLAFLAGLIASGVASDMGVFILGRILQGLGAGATTVALYVIVARIYPAPLHPRIFGLFAAMWVLPSLIGPPIAGLFADVFSWQWVFLGVAILVLFAGASVVPALRQLNSMDLPQEAQPSGTWGLPLAVVVAVGVLAISLGGDWGGAFGWPIAVVALVIVMLAVRPLLPTGTLLVRRGLPAAIVMRGAIAATFFATEIYLPYFFNERYGLPTWAAGLILTVGAISWSLGSAIQSRIGDRMSHGSVVRWGAVLLLVGIAVQAITATLMLSPVVAAIGWFVAGGGMGLTFPRLSTLVLGHSTESDQGFNSAAMSIADAVGGSIAIAVTGLVFAAAAGLGGSSSFVAALSVTTALALGAFFVALRVAAREE